MLEGGRIVERGTHQALLEAGGVYAAAFHAQDENGGADGDHAAKIAAAKDPSPVAELV